MSNTAMATKEQQAAIVELWARQQEGRSLPVLGERMEFDVCFGDEGPNCYTRVRIDIADDLLAALESEITQLWESASGLSADSMSDAAYNKQQSLIQKRRELFAVRDEITAARDKAAAEFFGMAQ